MQRTILSCSLLFILGVSTPAAAAERVLVRCAAGCDRLAAAVEALGGEVTHRYRYIDALAATLPEEHRGRLLEHPEAGTVYADAELPLPEPMAGIDLAPASGIEPTKSPAVAGLLAESARDFLYNTALTGARKLHLKGLTGDGVVVAVIDDGIVNRPGHVLSGKVIGGENLVPGAEEPSATSRFNRPHGTSVSCMIAAEGIRHLPAADPFIQSLEAHAPENVFACDGVSCPLGNSWVPVLGTAPRARLYAIKVAPADALPGSGMPLSRLLAALERPIILKRNYDAGVPSVPVAGDGSEENPYVYDSLNVRVINLSTGSGRTYYAGHQLKELMIEQLFAAGILPVIAATNDGPAAMTVTGSASSRGALSVGAAFTVPHARVFLDQIFGLGNGVVYLPSDHHQTRFSSVRGPSADGRFVLDVVANGQSALVQGPDLGFDLQSGTSLSSPTVAGAAALLFGAAPWASAAEVRAALVASADPKVLGDGSARIDQGHGYVDVPAALALVEAGRLDTTLPRGVEGATVAGNVAAMGFKPIRLGTYGSYTARVEDLRPGQVAHFFVVSSKKTDLLRVSLRDVVPELPPSQQNANRGDGIDLVVVDAPTSFSDLLLDDVFVTDELTVELAHPQTGLVRIAVVGSAGNAGRVSVGVVIEAEESPPAPEIATGEVRQGEILEEQVTVPPGTEQAVFELAWANNWGAYPTDDLDLWVIDPAGNLLVDGLTFRSPERLVIDRPMPGVWRLGVGGLLVHGVHGGDASHWVLRATDQNGDSL